MPVQLALLPLRRVIGRVLQRSQPDRSKSDSERVAAISTRNAPSVSTDRPGTGSQHWQTSGPKFGPTRYPAYRSIHWAGIGLGLLLPAPNRTQLGRAEMEAKPDPGEAFVGRVTVGGQVTRRNGRIVTGQALLIY